MSLQVEIPSTEGLVPVYILREPAVTDVTIGGTNLRAHYRRTLVFADVTLAFSRSIPVYHAFNIDVEQIAKKVLEEEFSSLVEQWHAERGATSSITEMVMCKAHLQIIGLGRAVIPLILRRMEREGTEPDMWFVALQMLTGADPMDDEIRGDFAAMAQRWLTWAAVNGYAW